MTTPSISPAIPAGILPSPASPDERQMLERFARFVEQKVLAAADERTRAIRLFVLAMTEVALEGMKAEG